MYFITLKLFQVLTGLTEAPEVLRRSVDTDSVNARARLAVFELSGGQQHTFFSS